MASGESHDIIENIGAVTRCLRALAAEAYAAFEVGTAQAKFLRYIGKHGGLSQADLARATATAPTLTGRALETLVERGWIRRKRSEEDRRQYVLELTASGQRMRQRVDDARQGIVDRVTAVLDERDLADFDRIAKKILTALAPPEEPDARP